MEFSVVALINVVIDYPFLYNKRHPDHKDRDKKLQAWNGIGDIFGMAGLGCRKKFKNLKDVYYRIKAAVKGKSKSDAGLVDISTVKWALFEEMRGIVKPFSQSAVPQTPQIIQKRQKRDAGEGRSQKELMEACLGHLGALRALGSQSKRDEIYHFCMRLDCRLRAIPKDRPRSVMNSSDNMAISRRAGVQESGANRCSINYNIGKPSRNSLKAFRNCFYSVGHTSAKYFEFHSRTGL